MKMTQIEIGEWEKKKCAIALNFLVKRRHGDDEYKMMKKQK